MAARLRESHVRARQAIKQSSTSSIVVEAHRPSDVLGVYLYLPVAGGVR